jgi:hypothetical protein
LALRAREPQEQTVPRRGPPPVALRGRRPPPSSTQSSSDEWQITRWAKGAGNSVMGLFGSSSEQPPNGPPPQNGMPSQNFAQQPTAGQGPPSAGAQNFQAGSQNFQPQSQGAAARGYDLSAPVNQQRMNQPVNGPIANSVPVQGQGAPPPQQAAKPWYKFWQ